MVIFYDYTSSASMSEIDSTTGLLHGSYTIYCPYNYSQGTGSLQVDRRQSRLTASCGNSRHCNDVVMDVVN